MAHFCLMVVGNDFKKILSSLNKYKESNLSEKEFKMEMSYIEMEKLYKNYEDKRYENIEVFAYDIYRYLYNDKEKSFGIYINPHSKFDNIKPGGRFSYNLNIKNKEEGTYFSLKKDIDFDRMKKEAKEKAIEFKNYFIHTLNYDENKFKENFGSDEENLLKSVSDYCYFPYFFNGKWNERGEKSLKEWAEEFENFFNNIHENENVILLDCHR